MISFSDYSLAHWGTFIILATLLVQSLVAAFAKAKQPGAVPGKMAADISHESFVFRSNRCMANSLENAGMMLATIFLALFLRADAEFTGYCAITFAIARVIHMVLYYKIATEKNPSPRSWFYLIALIANIALLANIVLTLLS